MPRFNRLAVICVTIATACDPDAGQSTADDIGAPIETVVIADETATARTVGQPELVIGEQDGYDYVDISGVVAVGDDIVVANRHSPPRIQVFGGDGALRATIGGAGEGPGEFRLIWSMWAEGDTIAALDTRLLRISRFDVNGNLVGTEQAAWMIDPAYIPWERFSDGSWLLLQNASERDPDDPGMTTRRVARVRKGGGVIELGRFNNAPMQRIGHEYEPVLFWPRTALFKAADDLFYYAYPGAYELHVFDTAGTYVRRITRNIRPAGISDEIRASLIAREKDDMRARGIADVDAEIAERAEPDALPMLAASAAVDDDRVVWVADYAVPGEEHVRWAGFDRYGAHVGDIDLPARFRPVVIDTDRLIGVWTDEMRVQSVRVYRLQ